MQLMKLFLGISTFCQERYKSEWLRGPNPSVFRTLDGIFVEQFCKLAFDQRAYRRDNGRS